MKHKAKNDVRYQEPFWFRISWTEYERAIHIDTSVDAVLVGGPADMYVLDNVALYAKLYCLEHADVTPEGLYFAGPRHEYRIDDADLDLQVKEQEKLLDELIYESREYDVLSKKRLKVIHRFFRTF